MFIFQKRQPQHGPSSLPVGTSSWCSRLSSPLATEAPRGNWWLFCLLSTPSPHAHSMEVGHRFSVKVATLSHLGGVISTPCGSPTQVPSGLEKPLQVFRAAPSCQLS